MRELTFEECHEVSGGMRGAPLNIPGGPGLSLPMRIHPEHQHIDFSQLQHTPPLPQRATCATLGAGAALMAIPLGPGGMLAAGGAASSLCDLAFKHSGQ